MLQLLRLIRGFLTFASGFVGLGVAVFLYLNDLDPSWEMRVLTSAALGLVTSVVVMFFAIKIHDVELFLGRIRPRARHRAGVVDWGGGELPSLR